MAWGVDAEAISAAGAIDVTLNCDTNLFIDPLLLDDASDEYFRQCATEAYKTRFNSIIQLLEVSNRQGDAPWRAAQLKLSFHEIPYTHLGYSSGTGGSGFGKKHSGRILTTAKEIVDLGIRNPDLFMVLALLEEGIGADRISDMTTNILFDCLSKFTKTTCLKIGIQLSPHKVSGKFYDLPTNPIDNKPIILVPKDIVRDLPIASDWASVGSAAQETQELRDRVNAQIGEIWRAKTKKDKREIRDNALRSKASFETLLHVLRSAASGPYDVDNDHRGEIYPAALRKQISSAQPLDLSRYSGRALSLDEVNSIVVAIIEKFQELVEKNGLWKEFWDDKLRKARLEKAMQRLFFAVASAYCDANKLDLSPESNAGCGPVDFKVSSGISKVLVEIKRSSNSALVGSYTAQLDAYRQAEKTTRAHYVVIDIGTLTSKKVTALSEVRSNLIRQGIDAASIIYIDGQPQQSASKR